MTPSRKNNPAYLLYAVASAAFIAYFALELNADVVLQPFMRIALLGAGCASVYCGSLTLARLADAERAAVIMRRSFAAFFAIYILLLLTFTLFDDVFGRNDNIALILTWGQFWERARESMNLVPFHTISLYIRGLARGAVTPAEFAVNLVGNLLAFMPMAFFLPLLFTRLRSWRRAALVTAACVCAVELLQLVFQKGYCDVDDLLLNVAGELAAYFMIWTERGAERVDKFTYNARSAANF